MKVAEYMGMHAKKGKKGNFRRKATYTLRECGNLFQQMMEGIYAQNEESREFSKFCKKVLRILGRYSILKRCASGRL